MRYLFCRASAEKRVKNVTRRRVGLVSRVTHRSRVIRRRRRAPFPLRRDVVALWTGRARRGRALSYKCRVYGVVARGR